MKILKINNNYYTKGGSDTVFFSTTKLLERAGHTAIPFCAQSPKDHATEYSNYFPLTAQTDKPKLKDSLNFLHNITSKKNLSKLIKSENNIDVAHLHIYYGKITASILSVLKANNIPIVQTLHEYKLACPIYTMEREGNPCNKCISSTTNVIRYKCKNNSYLHSMAMLIEFWASRMQGDIRLIDQFICVSNFQKNIMIEAGVPKEKIQLLYNFIDLNDYKPIKFSDKKNYFLYFGRIEKLKGLETLISAFKATGQKLIIAGGGVWEEELVSKIDKVNNIEFVGFTSGQELQKLIAEARTVLVPSEWYENCPMSILEAKALGTPVIGADIGGIPELINNGVDGYLFKPGDISSLVEALKKINDENLQEFSISARLDVEKRFSADVHLKELTKVYKMLTNSANN